MKTKICKNKDCNKEKDISNFYFRKDSNTYRNECDSCISKQKKEYRENNKNRCVEVGKKYRDEHSEELKDKRRAIKQDIINEYGGVCECCKNNIFEHLTIDHINSDGYLDNNSGQSLYLYLKREGYPKNNYRLLCYNCNCSRAINSGICGHQAIFNTKQELTLLPVINKKASQNMKCRCCFADLIKNSNWIYYNHDRHFICDSCSKNNIKYYFEKQTKLFKDTIFNHYDNKCSCCNEDNKLFFTIEHVNQDGNKHREQGFKANRLLRWIINNEFPNSITINCFNCNLSRGFYGYCPHEKMK